MAKTERTVTFRVSHDLYVEARKKIPLHGELSGFLRACLYVLASMETEDEKLEDIVVKALKELKK